MNVCRATCFFIFYFANLRCSEAFLNPHDDFPLYLVCTVKRCSLYSESVVLSFS